MAAVVVLERTVQEVSVEPEVLAAVAAEVLLVVLEFLVKVTMVEVVAVDHLILVRVAAAVLAQLVEQEHQQLVVMVALVHTQQ
jgi:hypothetical protein